MKGVTPDSEKRGTMPEGGEPITWVTPLAADAPAEPPLPGKAARPRVWPVFVVTAGALGLGMALSLVVMLIAGLTMALWDGESFILSGGAERLLSRPWILIPVLVTGQAVNLGAALWAASRSRAGLRERLGLVRGRITPWAAPLFMAGTAFVMFTSAIINGLIFEQRPEGVEDMSEAIRASSGLTLAVLVLAISVLPGVAEELLFRGFAQRRLVERWGPWAGIGVASVMFAAAHLDPVHAAGVLPLGVWMGIIAWRTGAVWPGMLCHFGNNLLASVLAGVATVSEGEMVSGWMVVAGLAMWLATGTAFVGSVLVLAFAGRRPADTVGA